MPAPIEVDLDTSSLLRVVYGFQASSRQFDMAIANALNIVGTQVVANVVQYLETTTGLAADDIARGISIQPASEGNLHWEMDARTVVLQDSPNWMRTWQAPGDNTFDTSTLLDIVTKQDATVCEICRLAQEQGPYTVAMINDLAAKWANYVPPYDVIGERTNLIHPNCRCVTQPHDMPQRISVGFNQPGQAAPQLMTIRQIGKTVAQELRIVLRTQVE